MNSRRCVQLVAVLVAAVAGDGPYQPKSIAIKGKLTCGNDPAVNVRVKLWEDDEHTETYRTLDQTFTSSEGEFDMTASTAEPHVQLLLKVYHDCLMDQRTSVFQIPRYYLTATGNPKPPIFSIGCINLETIFLHEGRSFEERKTETSN